MTFSGDRLRQERELRGISLREISEATKISLRFLEAIEQDRFEILPGGVFPRSFVKQYAEHIGLDGEAAMLEFVSTHQIPAEEEARPAPARRRRRDKKQVLRRLGVVVLAAGLLAVGLGFWPGAEDAPVSPPVADAPAPAAQPELPTFALPEPIEAVALDQGLVMVLRAEADCWVEVRADGRAVLNRVLVQGESTQLEAEDEFRISVGNAGGLSFSVNDQPGLPLGRSGEVRRNIVITRESLPTFVDPGARIDTPYSG